MFKSRAAHPRQGKRQDKGWLETLKTLFWAVLIAVLFRTFLFEPFHIPSSSMVPTLLIGDYMFVSKTSYGYGRYSIPFGFIPFSERVFASAPERGDVAVFRHPRRDGVDYVKRIIGLPGDTIQMSNGLLYINGTAVRRKRLADYVYQDSRTGRVFRIQRYLETLPNGRHHEILESRGDKGALDNTPPFTVPEGHVFVMGDNRDNSSDSRAEVGPVPMGNLIGRASFLFFSTDTARLFMPWTWPGGIRYSRLFRGIE